MPGCTVSQASGPGLGTQSLCAAGVLVWPGNLEPVLQPISCCQWGYVWVSSLSPRLLVQTWACVSLSGWASLTSPHPRARTAWNTDLWFSQDLMLEVSRAPHRAGSVSNSPNTGRRFRHQAGGETTNHTLHAFCIFIQVIVKNAD